MPDDAIALTTTPDPQSWDIKDVGIVKLPPGLVCVGFTYNDEGELCAVLDTVGIGCREA